MGTALERFATGPGWWPPPSPTAVGPRRAAVDLRPLVVGAAGSADGRELALGSSDQQRVDDDDAIVAARCAGHEVGLDEAR